MPELRPSQIETLRHLNALEGRARIDEIAQCLGVEDRSAHERLRRLAASRHCYVQLALRDGRYYDSEFGLTDKGRSALQAAGEDR
jgi:Mn-dependent DtxR family transcriptional regulator